MEIRVVREEKQEMEFELVGEDHAFCNALRKVLNDNEVVTSAAYRVEHPMLSSPRMLIKTKDIPLPKEARRIIPLSEVKGVAEKREQQLRKAGIKSANALAKADAKKVAAKSGVSEAVMKDLIGKASKLNFWRDSIPRHVLKMALEDFAKTFSEMRPKKST